MDSTPPLTRTSYPILVRVGTWLTDALFPRRCLGCRSYGSYCCTACLASLHFPRQLACPSCGAPNELGAFCSDCESGKALAGVWVTQYYGNPLIRELIHALKYEGLTELVVPLGQILTATLKGFNLPPSWHGVPRSEWCLVPVPLAAYRLRKRNFNQAELLAQAVRRAAELPLMNLLERRRATKPQNKLSAEERAANVARAFAVRTGAQVPGKTYILVDDVYTSGATLEACAEVLKQAGAREVWGLTVAKG